MYPKDEVHNLVEVLLKVIEKANLISKYLNQLLLLQNNYIFFLVLRIKGKERKETREMEKKKSTNQVESF